MSGPAPDQEISTGVEETTVAPVAESTEPPPLSDAWSEVMGIIPSQLHSQVVPKFREWDANFTRKVQEAHSEWEPYKPYKEQGIAPDQIDYALQIAQAIETRPEEVLTALTDYMRQNGQLPPEVAPVANPSTEQDPEAAPGDDAFFTDPRFVQLQNVVELMAQQLITANQQAQQAQEAAELDTEIKTLKEKYGEFDVDVVLAKAVAAIDAGKKVSGLEPFVQEFKQFETNLIAKSRIPAPKVLGGTGQADTNAGGKPTTDAERRQLVQQRLAAAAQQVL